MDRIVASVIKSCDRRQQAHVDLALLQHASMPSLTAPRVIKNHNTVKSAMAEMSLDQDQSVDQYHTMPAADPGV